MADGYIIELTNPLAAEGEPVKEVWYASNRRRQNPSVKRPDIPVAPE